MFKFFKNNDAKDHSKSDDELLSKTTSLLIHAAKIDENYTDKEKVIIKKTLIELGVEESKVTDEANFIDDLGADSLDTVELVMAFEEEFGSEISDGEAEKILTVGDAIKFIESKSA